MSQAVERIEEIKAEYPSGVATLGCGYYGFKEVGLIYG